MILIRLYFSFFKIGLLGFGGGMAIVRMIYDEINNFVSITQEQFANIVAVAQVTPGPIAVNTATYVGYESAGYLGAFMATLGVATPSFIIVALVAGVASRLRADKLGTAALDGIRPAAAGFMAAAFTAIAGPAIMSSKPLGKNIFAGSTVINTPIGSIDIIAVIIFLFTIYAIGRKKFNPFAVLIVTGLAGALLGA